MTTPANLFSLMTLLLLSSIAGAHDHASAQYLGNEGILVERGETKFLFDAFYSNGYDNYLLVDAETNAAMLAGTPPFDGVDAVFVSHAHGDHFSAEPTIAYLRAQPAVLIFGSTQVRDAIAAKLTPEDNQLLQRVIAFNLKAGDPPARLIHGKLPIEVVAITHVGGERHAKVMNLAFRVSVDDETTVMHLGDADANDALFAPLQSYWDEKPLTVAFPPYWFLDDDDGRQILNKRLKAEHSVGIHVPAAAKGNGDQWRGRIGGDLFTDPGERRTLSKPK